MNRKYPSISLVTSCFNHQHYIAETIESVISQKYPNIQYVVIDDNSSDGSWNVIKKYKKYLHHIERLEGYRKTPGYSLNYAFSKTDGQIMGWLNSDDILLPKSLYTIANIFHDVPMAEWVTGLATTIDENTEMVSSRLMLRNSLDYVNKEWSVIQQESTFFTRNLWNRTGAGLIEDAWAFDVELWTRFFPQATHYHATVPIGAFRCASQSKSVSDNRSFLDPCERHLDTYYKKAPPNLKISARLFKIAHKLALPLSLLPPTYFSKIPALRNWAYDVLYYSHKNHSWVSKRVNPFKASLLYT